MERKSILRKKNKKSKTVKIQKSVKFEIGTKTFKKKNSLQTLLFIIKEYIIDVLSYGDNISINDLEEVVVYLKKCLENNYNNKVHAKEFFENSKKKKLEKFNEFIEKNKNLHENLQNLKDLEFDILNEIHKIDSEINDIKLSLDNLKKHKTNKNNNSQKTSRMFNKNNNNNHRLNTEINIKQNFSYSHENLNNFNNDLVFFIQKEEDILNAEKLFDNDLKKVKNSLNNLLYEQKFNKNNIIKLNDLKENLDYKKEEEIKIMRGDSTSTSSSDSEKYEKKYSLTESKNVYNNDKKKIIELQNN